MSVNTWQGYAPEKLLQERFHISTGFHPGQRAIIERLLQGGRVLAIQCTGWGKSLCYQIASLYLPALTLVFSPLRALMRDQIHKCNSMYAIPAAILSSDFSRSANQDTLEMALAGKIKLLYITPERLQNALWKSYVDRLQISMVVIDEAHCISTWGHDFRPDFRRIGRLIQAIPATTPVLALTATANQQVEQDILQQMGPGVQIIRGPMARPNLRLHVVPMQGDQEKLSYLGTTLSQVIGTGLIYTATQKDAEMVATFLQNLGLTAEYYHASRDREMKHEIEYKLMSNQYKVVCSTNALGMGIDKHDVRFIIHYHLPASPIHYYQEIGRAGRDGYPAWCILLSDPNDAAIQEYFIRHTRPASQCYQHILTLLASHPDGLTERDIMRVTGDSQSITRMALMDLEEQQTIVHDKEQRYALLPFLQQLDFSDYDTILQHKFQELQDMQHYAQSQTCLMRYLINYLGDPTEHNCGLCGQCRPENFPTVQPSPTIQRAAHSFLDEEHLPRIEKRGSEKAPIHEAGWALSSYGNSNIGRLVRASKYDAAEAFPHLLVARAAAVLRARYPLASIQGIVSVPPTRSGPLVEQFARQVAAILALPYLAVIIKVRETQEQKCLKNRIQKEDNVRSAFVISTPELVRGRTLLLIDDILDSGQMLREVGRTLMHAGARMVYPLTITRTLHTDDQ